MEGRGEDGGSGEARAIDIQEQRRCARPTETLEAGLCLVSGSRVPKGCGGGAWEGG